MDSGYDVLVPLVSEAASQPVSELAAKRALASMDLTSLGKDDTEEHIVALCEKAVGPAGNVAAVCVYDIFVPLARTALAEYDVRVATVCNFPGGNAESSIAVAEARRQVELGAQEVDVVLPYTEYLSGNSVKAISLVEEVRNACGDNVLIKVILETGALQQNRLIAQACRDVIAAGANFLKTSTGKIPAGATLEAVAVMLDVIRDRRSHTSQLLGCKPSGGISSVQSAAGYLYLADQILGEGWATPETFRFGASSLLADVMDVLGYTVSHQDSSGY